MASGQLRIVRPEGLMRHDWIFDTLSDLQDYARRNDLPELCLKLEETLVTARREIGAQADMDGPVPISICRQAH
jgi:hypothetical protein